MLHVARDFSLLMGRPTREGALMGMRASFLLSFSLCDAVTGGEDGQAMLEKLERRWYHYLFNDFLRGRLRRETPRHRSCGLRNPGAPTLGSSVPIGLHFRASNTRPFTTWRKGAPSAATGRDRPQKRSALERAVPDRPCVGLGATVA